MKKIHSINTIFTDVDKKLNISMNLYWSCGDKISDIVNNRNSSMVMGFFFQIEQAVERKIYG